MTFLRAPQVNTYVALKSHEEPSRLVPMTERHIFFEIT